MFAELLRKANKIVNLFVEKYVPGGGVFLIAKKEAHYKTWEKYDAIMEASLRFTQEERLDEEKLGKAVIALITERMKDNYIHRQSADPFDLYPTSDDRNDDDINVDPTRLTQELAPVLKEMKSFIKQGKAEIKEIEQLDRVLFKVIVAFKMLFDDLENIDNNEMECYQNIFEQWCKICGWVIEEKEASRALEIEMPYDSFYGLTCTLYTCFAYFLAIVKGNEAKHFLAESFLALAESLLPEMEKNMKADRYQPQLIQCVKFIQYSTHACIALGREAWPEFERNVEKAQGYVSHASSTLLINVLDIAGKKLEERHPEKALFCFEKAEELAPHFFKGAQSKIDALTQRWTSASIRVKERLCPEIKAEVKQKYKEVNVRWNKEGVLFFYIPLEEVWPDLNKSLKRLRCIQTEKIFNREVVSGKVYTGVKFKCLSWDKDKIKSDLSNAFKRIEENKAVNRKRQEKRERQNSKKKEIEVSADIKPVSYFDDCPSLPLSSLSLNSPFPKKKKDKKEIILSDAPKKPILQLPPRLYAKEKGFQLDTNPEITPVYSCLKAQQERRTNRFVYWEGVPGVEATVEELFKKALNPTEEGVATVPPVNKPGFKLFIRNGQEVLRLKRMGHGGWLRVQAVLKEIIEDAHGPPEIV